jgi:hypothetical protein
MPRAEEQVGTSPRIARFDVHLSTAGYVRGRSESDVHPPYNLALQTDNTNEVNARLFIRRACRVACMVSVAAWIAACAASSKSQPLNDPQNTAPVRDQENERDIGALVAELRAMRQQAAEDARSRATQKDPGGPPIWSNWVLIIVAGFAGFVAWMTLRPIRQEANATAEMMRVSHRPKIKIRNVVVPGLNYEHPPAKLTGSLWAHNAGASPAIVARLHAQWMFDPLPMQNPATLETTAVSEQIIGVGQIAPVQLPEMELADDRWLDLRTGKALYLVGVIKYWNDDKAVMRRTFFCRRYDFTSGRFGKVQDDDYEYEE